MLGEVGRGGGGSSVARGRGGGWEEERGEKIKGGRGKESYIY